MRRGAAKPPQRSTLGAQREHGESAGARVQQRRQRACGSAQFTKRTSVGPCTHMLCAREVSIATLSTLSSPRTYAFTRLAC